MKRLEDFLVTGLINEDGGISGDDTPAARQAADKMAGVCGGIPPLLARDLPSEQPSEQPSEKPWNWREHTREENIARGKEVEKKREQRRLKNLQDLASSRRPSMQSAKSFDPAEVKARNAASDLMNAIQNPNLYSDEEKAELSKRARETNALAQPAQPAKQPKKISGMYWVTDQDFKTATGMDYDAMSREHQRLFFDLVARGTANVPSTTGVGQGPAYGSAEYFTMRQRPQEVPKYGTPTAWYDKVDGQVAATTSQSRQRAEDEAAKQRVIAQDEKDDARLRAIAAGNAYRQSLQSEKDAIKRRIGYPGKENQDTKKPTVDTQSRLPDEAQKSIDRLFGRYFKIPTSGEYSIKPETDEKNKKPFRLISPYQDQKIPFDFELDANSEERKAAIDFHEKISESNRKTKLNFTKLYGKEEPETEEEEDQMNLMLYNEMINQGIDSDTRDKIIPFASIYRAIGKNSENMMNQIRKFFN